MLLLRSSPASTPCPTTATVLILGVGDLDRADEGLGIHAIRRLAREIPLAGVRLLDGGIPGVNLVGEFEHVRAVLILDGVRDGRAAGTISCREAHSVDDLPRGLGAPDYGLKDLVAALALTGRHPQLFLYTISLGDHLALGPRLSPEVSSALAPLVWLAHGHAARLAAEFASENFATAARTWPTDAEPVRR